MSNPYKAHRYYRKPLSVTAICYNGNNAEEVAAMLSRLDIEEAEHRSQNGRLAKSLIIRTHKGIVRVPEGYWILSGLDLPFERMSADEFKELFNPYNREI